MPNIQDTMHNYSLLKEVGKCDTVSSKKKMSRNQLKDVPDVEILKDYYSSY